MHLIDENGGIHSLDLGIDLATRMLHTEGEAGGDGLEQLVEVELLLLERGRLLVKHRHLEHLLYQET